MEFCSPLLRRLGAIFLVICRNSIKVTYVTKLTQLSKFLSREKVELCIVKSLHRTAFCNLEK